MDILPLETLLRIFELACTDGGYTGCSLSQVSKEVRAISSAVRFHSVFLIASPRRLRSFIALFERECNTTQGHKPHVRHLYVAFPSLQRDNSPDAADAQSFIQSLRRPPSGSPPPVASYPSPTTELLKLLELPDNAPELAEERPKPAEAPDPTASAEYFDAARTLFRLVGPDLVSLMVQCEFGDGAPDLPIIERPFPRLREVTVVGIADPSAMLTKGADGTPPLFPAATHLYFAPHGVDIRVAFWSKHAPRVTHLAMSRANGGNYIDQIAPAIGVPGEYVGYLRERSRRAEMYWDPDGALEPLQPPKLPNPPPPRTYPSVRCLLMVPAHPQRYMCGNGYRQYFADLAVVRDAGTKAWERGVTAIVADAPEPSDWPHRGDCARARENWVLRVEGKAGCWVAFAAEPDLPPGIVAQDEGGSSHDSDVDATDSSLHLG
ncbi:hypothetical protein OH77DRAFT_1423909 [Trametes cingulata]|nr:hypothetical protein OH77DRAFT_1423909 [Trametes cingulata]